MKKSNSSSRERQTLLSRVITAPYMVWAVLFIIVPLVFIAYYAFTDDNFAFTLENITRFFTATSEQTADDGTITEVHTYILIFWRSVRLAVISTFICFLIGYPIAYFISKMSPKMQKTMITIIMIPMWMNFLIRTYAWMTILQDTGIINTLLNKMGLSTVHIIGTQTAVVIGMVYDYLPYMILPIYSVMAKLDHKLVEAAHDLGCNSFQVLCKVIFPLTVPGVISGITMVLIPSVSTFYISQKLGSGKFFLIGDAIEGQYTANNLHFAAAIALIMMIVLLAAMAVLRRATSIKPGRARG